MERASRRFAAQASLLWVAVVWAGAFSAIKALLDHGMAAEDVTLLRYLVAAPGFALVLWRAGGLPGLTRGDALRLAAAGVLVVAGVALAQQDARRARRADAAPERESATGTPDVTTG